MIPAPAPPVRRVWVRWVGYPGMPPGEPGAPGRPRPDVLVLAVRLTDVGEDALARLAGVRDEADVVAAVIYSPRDAGPAGAAERAVLRFVRESSDVVVHGSDPELIHEVLSGIGELEAGPEPGAH